MFGDVCDFCDTDVYGLFVQIMDEINTKNTKFTKNEKD